MKTINLVPIILLTMLLVADVPAASVEFELVVHPNNVHLLPQPKGDPCVSGDHLLQTADDITGSTFNPDGCFSFNFMNPVGISEPDYPPGYAEGIHSMTGSVTLEMDLYAGGMVEIISLAFGGYVARGKPVAQQWLVQSGDPAADGNHGSVDGIPNDGVYAASAAANWAFGISFDWYYDTPFAGSGGIDMTFNDYQWSGFIIPVSELTTTGMAMTTLNDPLGYFAGTSEEFESWLLRSDAGIAAGCCLSAFRTGRSAPSLDESTYGNDHRRNCRRDYNRLRGAAAATMWRPESSLSARRSEPRLPR